MSLMYLAVRPANFGIRCFDSGILQGDVVLPILHKAVGTNLNFSYSFQCKVFKYGCENQIRNSCKLTCSPSQLTAAPCDESKGYELKSHYPQCCSECVLDMGVEYSYRIVP